MAEYALQADLDRGTAGDRYQVVLHVEAGADAETSRRLSCDTSVVVMREGPDGSVLDVGRRTRTAHAVATRTTSPIGPMAVRHRSTT